jgi:hypothetical protein
MAEVPNRAHDPKRVVVPTHEESRATLENMFSHMEAEPVKDPFTGITHVDLSDPNHPFWGPNGYYGNKKESK